MSSTAGGVLVLAGLTILGAVTRKRRRSGPTAENILRQLAESGSVAAE